MRSMAGYQERPHFLLEFAPGGPRHHELVTEKPEEEITKETNSTIVNELPNKVDKFLEVSVIDIIRMSQVYFMTCIDFPILIIVVHQQAVL